MAYEFTASRVSGDGNAVFPDKLIITYEYVIYRKSRVIGYKETKIRLSAVGSVSVRQHLLFADIIIESKGGNMIEARGFSRSDARRIANLLEE
ncbi:MAG: PH domain-containing protein [bacterium]|nr:PH domain-containing protein [bacterium]MDD6900436.1 PH domain-containing protein [bacterium]